MGSLSKDSSLMAAFLVLSLILGALLSYIILRDTVIDKALLERIARIERVVNSISQNRYTSEDHAAFQRSLQTSNLVVNERINRIFTRLRLIEHRINLEPEGE